MNLLRQFGFLFRDDIDSNDFIDIFITAQNRCLALASICCNLKIWSFQFKVLCDFLVFSVRSSKGICFRDLRARSSRRSRRDSGLKLDGFCSEPFVPVS